MKKPTATTTRAATSRSIPYEFTPTPRLMRELRRRYQRGRKDPGSDPPPKVTRTDFDVLEVLLDFRKAYRDSCWCSKAKIARELDCSERTVQRSLGRLEQAGVIQQVRVSGPHQVDPDEPINRTGWRIYFRFITERRNLGDGPDRGIPESPSWHARRPGGRPKSGAERVTKMSLSGETGVHCADVQRETKMSPSEGDKNVSQFQTHRKLDAMSLSSSSTSTKTTTTQRAPGSKEPPEIHACVESSSSSSNSSTRKKKEPEKPATPPAIPGADLDAFAARYAKLSGRTLANARAKILDLYECNWRIARAQPDPIRFEASWIGVALSLTEDRQAQAPALRQGPAAASVKWAELTSAVLDQYREQGAARSTIDVRRQVLLILAEQLGARTNRSLNDAMVRKFAAYLADKSPRQSIHLMTVLRSICRECVELGLLPSLPRFPKIPHHNTLPMGRRSIAPPEDEVRRTLDHLRQRNPASWEYGRLCALASVVALAGAKMRDVLRLHVRDVDLAAGTIVIRKTRMGAEFPVTIRITRELGSILAEWLKRVECEWVIPGKRRLAPWDPRQRDKAGKPVDQLKAAAREIGIEGITFERLRRFYREHAVAGLPDRPDSRRESTTSPPPRKPAIELGTVRQPVFVRGVSKGVLTRSEHKAIKILLRAFPNGLTSKEMTRDHDTTGWRKALRRLKENDADFRTAIGFPRDLVDGEILHVYCILPW